MHATLTRPDTIVCLLSVAHSFSHTHAVHLRFVSVTFFSYENDIAVICKSESFYVLTFFFERYLLTQCIPIHFNLRLTENEKIFLSFFTFIWIELREKKTSVEWVMNIFSTDFNHLLDIFFCFRDPNEMNFFLSFRSRFFCRKLVLWH